MMPISTFGARIWACRMTGGLIFDRIRNSWYGPTFSLRSVPGIYEGSIIDLEVELLKLCWLLVLQGGRRSCRNILKCVAANILNMVLAIASRTI